MWVACQRSEVCAYPYSSSRSPRDLLFLREDGSCAEGPLVIGVQYLFMCLTDKDHSVNIVCIRCVPRLGEEASEAPSDPPGVSESESKTSPAYRLEV